MKAAIEKTGFYQFYTQFTKKGCRLSGVAGISAGCAMIALFRRHVVRLRLVLAACIAIFGLGCVGTWEEYNDSRGAGKADSEVAIFKAHLDNTRRIVSASDEQIEYQYDPVQAQAPWSAGHPLIRLMPGQYKISVNTWPFGTQFEFEVDLKAGHKYKVETYLCNFECRKDGKPYRHDRWIEDITAHEPVSGVVSECYFAKARQRERRKVPCPDEDADRGARSAGKATTAAVIVGEDETDSGGTGMPTAAAAADSGGKFDSRDAGKATAAAATEDEDEIDSRAAGTAMAATATDDEEEIDSRSAAMATTAAATDDKEKIDSRDAGKATAVAAAGGEAKVDFHGADMANAAAAIFKVHMEKTRRITSTSDGRIEYQYDPELKRVPRSDPHSMLRLLPGRYTIAAETWPFGSLNEFEADLKAGHTYEVATSLCSFECISTGEPYRHDRWIQDLTAGERISGVISECYLGKKRGRDRQKVPCPDD